MNRSLENDRIVWLNMGDNCAVVIKNQADFLHTEYKVMQNEQKAKLVPGIRMDFNGLPMLYYQMGSLRSLSALLSSMKETELMQILNSLLEQCNSIVNNGFLQLRSVALDMDSIYVDQSKYIAYLIYIPCRSRFYVDVNDFEDSLRDLLINIITGSQLVTQFTWQNKLSKLQGSPHLDLNEMRHLIMYDRQNAVSGFSNGPRLYLCTLSSPRQKFRIEKPNCVIGRKQECDVALLNAGLVGRHHADLIMQNGVFLLVDNNSKNGTFVNGQRLYPKNPYQLKEGDMIRFGNVDMRVEFR